MKRLALLIFLISPALGFGDEIKLSGGTAIVLVTSNSFSSDNISVGETITASVATPVVVNGITVIDSGALATGVVSRAEDSGMVGQSGKISLEFNSVLAVDGTLVPIVATKTIEEESEVAGTVVVSTLLCPLALLNEGDAAIIPAGTQIRAISIEEVVVKT